MELIGKAPTFMAILAILPVHQSIAILTVLVAALAPAPASHASQIQLAQAHQFGDLGPAPVNTNQPLPAGQLENNAKPYEKETQQIGGSGNHQYLQVGALRCKPRDAMIGVRVRRGAVVEFLQVVCAPVTCKPDRCLWGDAGQPYLGTYAGVLQGSNPTMNMFCLHGYVVAGFRAGSTQGDGYLADVAFECAQQSGQPKAAQQTLYPIAQPGMIEDVTPGTSNETQTPPASLRMWVTSIDDKGNPVPDSLGQSGGVRVSQCNEFGATGLSVAVGRWGQMPAIEAFSMFCGGSRISNSGASARR
jgi:hypothetical protein